MVKKTNGVEVTVKGWVDKPEGTERDTWIDEYSDHSLLYLEVEEVT